jgi:hypothetical protein
MNRKCHGFGIRSTLIVAATCTSLVVLLIFSHAPGASAQLPTRPPNPTATPAPRIEVSGGEIELHAQFSSTWPWRSVPWQNLWTIVQWRGTWGVWHDVEGWQGGFDDVTTGEAGEIIGEKAWWVLSRDLGKGPFRWVVLRAEAGETVGVSEPFYLPSSIGEMLTVDALIEP